MTTADNAISRNRGARILPRHNGAPPSLCYPQGRHVTNREIRRLCGRMASGEPSGLLSLSDFIDHPIIEFVAGIVIGALTAMMLIAGVVMCPAR